MRFSDSYTGYFHEIAGIYLTTLDIVYDLSRQLAIVDGPFDWDCLRDLDEEGRQSIARSVVLFFGKSLDEIPILD